MYRIVPSGSAVELTLVELVPPPATAGLATAPIAAAAAWLGRTRRPPVWSSANATVSSTSERWMASSSFFMRTLSLDSSPPACTALTDKPVL
jgi:hypothetical protein